MPDSINLADFALWSQHDNTGCQSGMLRQHDGSVLFWHTEEDAVNFFDKPRAITIDVAGESTSAFVYPYLLPGPAFGWRDNQFLALDSLHIRQSATTAGTLTNVAAWLLWRVASNVDSLKLLQSLTPFADACALNVIQNSSGRVTAATYEIGGQHVVRRSLSRRNQSVSFQVNAVSQVSSALGKLQRLTRADMAPYEKRIARTANAMKSMLAEPLDLMPGHVLALLADRRGGSYAYANRDVKSHCLGRMGSHGLELYVQSGAALPDDEYLPQWRPR